MAGFRVMRLKRERGREGAVIHISKGIVALPGAAMISKSIYAFVSICDGWGRRLLATGPHVQNFTTVAASVVVAMPVRKKGGVESC